MAQAATSSAFHEFQLTPEFGFCPSAFPHLFCRQSMPRTIRLWQIHEWTFWRLKPTQCFIHLLPQMWSETSSYALNVVQILAPIFTNNQG